MNAPVSAYLNINNFVLSRGGWAYFLADPLNVGFRALAALLNSSTQVFTLWSKDNLEIAKNSAMNAAEYYGLASLALLREAKKGNRREKFVAYFDEKFLRVHIKVIAGKDVRVMDLAHTSGLQEAYQNSQEVVKHLKGELKEPIRCSVIFGILGSAVAFTTVSGLIGSAVESSVQSGLREVSDFLRGGANLLDFFFLLFSICSSDAIEIDMRNLFENFGGLRKLIPVWTYTSSQFGDSIWMEWECGGNSLSPKFEVLDPATGYLTCARRALLTDSEHFTDRITIGAGIMEVAGVPVTQVSEPRCDLPFEDCIKLYGGINPITSVPRDGESSRLPYFLFQDPSFFNSLYINPERVGKTFCGAPSSRHIPRGVTGVCEINALLWHFSPK